jgi:ribosomal-protein-alanine N-acetyltransferase
VNVTWIIRKALASDLDRIVEIENSLFLSPWSRRSFESELIRPGGIVLTAEADCRPIGYAIGWCVADEIHIANLGVHPDWQKRGVGQALMETLMRNFPEAAWAGLEVRSSNIGAIGLYRKLGFRKTGVRKKYYAEEGEDAVLMEKKLSPRKRGKHGTRSVV